MRRIRSGTWRIETRRFSQIIAMFDQVCQRHKLRINAAQRACVVFGSLQMFVCVSAALKVSGIWQITQVRSTLSGTAGTSCAS